MSGTLRTPNPQTSTIPRAAFAALNVSQPLFSLARTVRDPISDSLTLDEIVDQWRTGGEYHAHVETLRALPHETKADKDTLAAFKQRYLPAVCIGGTFLAGGSPSEKTLLTDAHHLCLDLDSGGALCEAEELRETLADLPFAKVVARSCSGRAWLLVLEYSGDRRAAAAHAALLIDAAAGFALTARGQHDYSRRRFMTYDPLATFRPEAQILVAPIVAIATPIAAPIATPIAAIDMETLRSALPYVSPFRDGESWRKILWGVRASAGDEAREIMEQWSTGEIGDTKGQPWPEPLDSTWGYDSGAFVRQWDRKDRPSGGSTHLTLLQLATRAGWNGAGVSADAFDAPPVSPVGDTSDEAQPKGPLFHRSRELLAKRALGPPPAFLTGFIRQRDSGIIYARGGVGKSTLAMTFADACIHGRTWAGHDIRAGSVLLLCADDEEGATQRICMIASRGDDAVGDVVLAAEGFVGSLPKDQKTFQRVITAANRALVADGLLPVVLILLDSVDALEDKDGTGWKATAQSAQAFMDCAAALARDNDCSTIAIHHSTKNGGDSNSDRGGQMAGADQFRNRADFVWEIIAHKNGEGKTGAVSAKVVKSRSGSTGETVAYFEASSQVGPFGAHLALTYTPGGAEALARVEAEQAKESDAVTLLRCVVALELAKVPASYRAVKERTKGGSRALDAALEVARGEGWISSGGFVATDAGRDALGKIDAERERADQDNEAARAAQVEQARLVAEAKARANAATAAARVQLDQAEVARRRAEVHQLIPKEASALEAASVALEARTLESAAAEAANVALAGEDPASPEVRAAAEACALARLALSAAHSVASTTRQGYDLALSNARYARALADRRAGREEAMRRVLAGQDAPQSPDPAKSPANGTAEAPTAEAVLGSPVVKDAPLKTPRAKAPKRAPKRAPKKGTKKGRK